jgi:hypothetical protein
MVTVPRPAHPYGDGWVLTQPLAELTPQNKAARAKSEVAKRNAEAEAAYQATRGRPQTGPAQRGTR